MGKSKKNFYAVAKGNGGPQIYRTWPECQSKVSGFPGAVFKGFATESEAQAFIQASGGGGGRGGGRAAVTPVAPSRAGQPQSMGGSAAPRARTNVGAAGKGSVGKGSGKMMGLVRAGGETRGVQPGEIGVFTDGACKGNQNVATTSCPSGWGVAIVEGCTGVPPVGGDLVRELYGPVCLDSKSPSFIGAEVGSNNTGELSAMCEAFRWLAEYEETRRAAVYVHPPLHVRVFPLSLQRTPPTNTHTHAHAHLPSRLDCSICYDSKYAANQAQGIHRAHKNILLSARSKELLREVRKTREVRFLHVKGHSGHRWNDAADAAANRGAAGHQTPDKGVGPTM